MTESQSLAGRKHRLTAKAFLDLKIPRAPSVSPDGSKVVFEVSEADFEESRYVTRLWLADVASARSRQITFSYEGEHAPRWSPDGRWIAFLSARPDMTEPPPEDEEDEHKDQLWVLPAEGGEAQRLTSVKEGVRDYAWAPDNKTLLFLADEARPQPLQYVHTDKRKRRVDPVVEHEERPRRQFWEVGVEDKKADLLYTGDRGIADFAICPRGSRLAYVSNGTGDPNDYHQFDLFVLDIGEPEEAPEAEEFEQPVETGIAAVTGLDGAGGRDDDGDGTESMVADESGEAALQPEPIRVANRAGAKFGPQWSPDGSRIAFLSGLDPALSYSQECIWTVDSGGGDPVNLFESLSYDAHDIVWPKRGPILALVSHRTNRPIISLSDAASAESGFLTPIYGPIECLDVAASPDGSVVVAVIEDDSHPPELCVVEPGGNRRALTELNKEFVDRYELPRQEVIRWYTDIGEIEGILVHPLPGSRGDLNASPDDGPLPPPLILEVHGGPKGHAVSSLRSYGQHALWATEGYRVFMPNYRGSEGYGNAFAVANRRDLGGGDFRDIMAGIEHLIEDGLADPNRLGILGGSYGGFMTNWAIGQTDRFAAAISMFGIFNLVTDYSNSSLPRWDPEYMGAYYWEDPEVYSRCSPSTYLAEIRTPVLIIHGDSDENTNLSNSKEMYQALRARGVTCQFVHYPREGHGVREPNHKLDEIRRCMAWFDTYLKHSGEPRSSYRLEEKTVHDGYEIHMLRAEDGEYSGRLESDGRLLDLTFSLASSEPVESGWKLALAEVKLESLGGDDGAEWTSCPFMGVPASAGGGRYLLQGEDLYVDVQPDEKTGRLSVALTVAFAIPPEGGEFRAQIADFPPVDFTIGPKEEKLDSAADFAHDTDSPTSAASTVPEQPLETPRGRSKSGFPDPVNGTTRTSSAAHSIDS